MIRKSYKFRLKPTTEQGQLLRQHGGNARFVWNHFLRLNEIEYEKNKKFVFGYDLIVSLPKLKKEYDFLGLSFSHSLQSVGRHFDRALHDFIEGRKEFPKYKKKAKERDGFAVPDKFRIGKTFVFIPKIGEVAWIKHRPIKGKVKHLTVKQDGDQWYCSVNVEIKAKKPEIKDENIVGIDVGLKTYATLSDGEKVENPRILKKYQKRLVRAQRKLSRTKKSGSNRWKQRVRVARLHRKVRNVRKDFQHKTTSRMIAKYDGFVLEDLNIKGMVRNHHLAKAISDAAWYECKRQLKYKSEWFGKLYLEVDRWEPSSKTCNRCGEIKSDLTLADRVFRCDGCGFEEDRDLNAALNIRDCGLEVYRGTHGKSCLGSAVGSCLRTGGRRCTRKKNVSVCLV